MFIMIRNAIFLVLLTCFACQNDGSISSEPPPIHHTARQITLNLDEGYERNPITGDTIRPIMLKTGEALRTGVPQEISGHVRSLSDYKPPRQKKLSEPNRVELPQHQRSVVEWKKVDLSPNPIELDNSSTFFTKSNGEEVALGVPQPYSLQKTLASLPQTRAAGDPIFGTKTMMNIRTIDVDQGLPSSYINSIAMDGDGNIWFASWGGGISKYDGVNFNSFSSTQGLSHNLVWDIQIDHKDRLWAVTEGDGVSMYDGKYFYKLSEEQGLHFGRCRSIFVEEDGPIWIGTSNGLSRLEGDSITLFLDPVSSRMFINDIVEDVNGDLWFATSSGLIRYDGDSFTQYAHPNSTQSSLIHALALDGNGHLWFGGDKTGLMRYDGSQFYRYEYWTDSDELEIQTLTIDNKNDVWVGTIGAGAYHVSPTYCRKYSTENGLENNAVHNLLIGDAGEVWVGTYGGGVSIIKESSFVNYREESGISSHLVWSIIQDSHGDLWFATNDGGVNKFDGKFFNSYSIEQGLPIDRIISVYEDKKKNLWIGTWQHGLCKYDGHELTIYDEEQGLDVAQIVSMQEGQNGDLWMAAYGQGIIRFDGSSFTHFTQEFGFCTDLVSLITNDSKNNLWFATEGCGVAKYDGKNFTFYTEKEGLIDDNVICITEDSDGNMWFGTFGGGISIFDGDHFLSYTKDEGLSNNNVWSIIEDKNQTVWVATDQGLTQFVRSYDRTAGTEPGDKSKIGSFVLHNYDKQDGLRGVDFYVNSVLFDRQSRLWWGSGKSVTMLDVNEFYLSDDVPAPHLNRIEINEKQYNFYQLPDSLHQFISYDSVRSFTNLPVHLELDYRQNHVAFYFVGIDWQAPHKIRYSYRMNGVNEAWSQPSREVKADYRNLPHGEYTFLVRAIGESGRWSQPVEYSFVILPPWWSTWWARAVGILCLIGLISGFIRWRTKNLKRRQRQLEDTVRIRTAEVVAEKERSDELLLNILPSEIAEELKSKGSADARSIEQVSVIFTDFEEFTAKTVTMSPKELVDDINECFSEFDRIIEKHGIEKIKTIGDAYMAAGGLPSPNSTHPVDVVRAALDIRDFIEVGKKKKMQQGRPFFEVRIGVHTGPVVAGIVGIRKFQYDIWGDTVNTASRMESSSHIDRVNISQSTYDQIKDHPEFQFENRGQVSVKGKGEINMYFVERRNPAE